MALVGPSRVHDLARADRQRGPPMSVRHLYRVAEGRGIAGRASGSRHRARMAGRSGPEATLQRSTVPPVWVYRRARARRKAIPRSRPRGARLPAGQLRLRLPFPSIAPNDAKGVYRR